jgi:hypothetical protein
MDIPISDPLAKSLIAAIHRGDLEMLRKLLDGNPGISRDCIVDANQVGRTLLHIATDWPGHFPNVTRTIGLLIERGAEPNAPVIGAKTQETPLHWAASSNDVTAIDALLDGGANIECAGAIFTNGTAMSDAVIFANWDTARRLLERGAKTTLTQSAALGMKDRVTAWFDQDSTPPSVEITAALWHACRGGQLQTVQYLLEKGANLNWVGWDNVAPLDGAQQSGNHALVEWLREQGAKPASELTSSANPG